MSVHRGLEARCSRPWLCAVAPRCPSHGFAPLPSGRYSLPGLRPADALTMRAERHVVLPTSVASSPPSRFSTRLGSSPLVHSPLSSFPAHAPASAARGSTNLLGYIANRNQTRAPSIPYRRTRMNSASSSSASKKLETPRSGKRLARQAARTGIQSVALLAAEFR